MLGGNQQSNNVTGSSVAEQWGLGYPEVSGSIPAQFQLFINFQINWASELTMIVIMYRNKVAV